MGNLKELTESLGGVAAVRSPQSDFKLIEIIRKGLPSETIGYVADSLGVSEEVALKSLGIARRTAARRKASDRLKPGESELVYRLTKVLVEAEDILGDLRKARSWMLASNVALNGERPIDLLDTGIGFQDVLDVLHRIEFGVYS